MKKKENEKRHLAIKYLIGIVSLLCAIVLVYRGGYQAQPMSGVGEISDQDIRAQIDFSYTDKKATESQKEQAVEAIPALYYLDQSIKDDATKRIEELFFPIINKEDLESIKEKDTWLDSEIAIKTLLHVSSPEQVKQNTLKICTELLDKGIITSSTRIKIISSGKDTISLRDAEINIDKVIVEDDLNSILDSRLRAMHPFDRPVRQAIRDVIIRLLRPNLVYDYEEVKRRKEVAMESVEPICRNVKKGQIIIRRGDPVTETHRMMLEAQAGELNKAMGGFNQWWNISGSALLVGIFFFILVTYLHYHQPEIFSCNKRLVLLGIIIVSILCLTRLSVYIPVSSDKPFWQYFVIIPVSAMLIAILMDKELAIISSMIMSVLATVVMKQTLPYTVIILFGSIIAILSTTSLLHRWEFLRAGVFIGIAHILAIIMVDLLKFYSIEQFSWKIIGYQLLGGFSGGLVCAMVVSICLPILERAFDITTDIRLLELSDLNHPLLKRMITEAPGTYHHSIVVSNMAEDAARSIVANPLMAKVGGYFHDIGKITKPEYFVENVWFEKESRHEKLLPTMSNLVITAHVKDGNQLAQKYKLPRVITDIISEHHGTSLVYYFYKQAEKSSEEGVEVREEDFRYPGPKPQTKESGIILLADTIEAASHTLVKPTPSKIEELVRDISNEKINDGQLDECGLTLRDIDIIRERFTNILTGILHKRIEYPEKNESSDKQSTGNANKHS